jgi:hypothetical protein
MIKFFKVSQVGIFIISAIAARAAALPDPDLHTLSKRSSPPPPNDTFEANILSYVNNIRSNHAAAPLTWDATLATYALGKSNGCKVNHVVSTTSYQVTARIKEVDILRARTARTPTISGFYPQLRHQTSQLKCTVHLISGIQLPRSMRIKQVTLLVPTISRRLCGRQVRRLGVRGVRTFVLEITRRIGGFIVTLIRGGISCLIMRGMLLSENTKFWGALPCL